MRKSKFFLPFSFYVKSIFASFESQKTVILTILEVRLQNLVKFQTQKSVKIFQNQNSMPLIIKIANLRVKYKTQKSVKIL